MTPHVNICILFPKNSLKINHSFECQIEKAFKAFMETLRLQAILINHKQLKVLYNNNTTIHDFGTLKNII